MLLYVHVVLCVCFVLKVFLTEYAGPLVIYLLFYARPALIYGAEASVSQHTWASQSVTCWLSFCPNLSHNWTKMHIYAHFLCWTSLESVAYLCAFLLNWSELIAYLCVLSLLGLNDELLQLDIQVSVCLSVGCRVACACWTLHYAKRLLETVFIHRFSHSTMPIRNIFKVIRVRMG